MLKPLEVIITSGSIISKIDDIRNIGNFSQGTTGALIAEEFLKQGAIVHYVYGYKAKRPFRHKLVVNPDKQESEEIERVKIELKNFKQYSDQLKEYPAETFEEYFETLKNLVSKPESDVVILSAAVADYGTKKQLGKISSDMDNWQIDFVKNTKVISLVKKLNPKIFQVGFKLLTTTDTNKLIDTAYKEGIKNKSNLTVANSVINGDVKNRQTIFITPEKGLIPAKLDEVAPKLVQIIKQRFSKQHYQTALTIDSQINISHQKEFEALKQNVKKFWQLNLFEPYFTKSNMHFGFVAMRASSNEFVITTRGSDKENLPDEDIAYVWQTDFVKKKIYVRSLKKKASLNANVAAKIFQERPEVNIIVHAHVSIGNQNQTEIDYAPGTEEDTQEVIKYLKKKEQVVELKNHGIIVVGATSDDIVKTLDSEPAYTKFPELYDLIYYRFQKNLDFINLIKQETPTTACVLDLATGTGEVAKQLVQSGYKNIILADKNLEMLKVAKNKINFFLHSHATSIEDMELEQAFDVVVIRQAINYLMNYRGLVKGFKKIYQHLNLGGKLIFNAPNHTTNTAIYNNKLNEYQKDGWDVKVEEMNILQNKILIHSQRCILTKIDLSEIKKVYDLNSFGMFTKDEFEQTLHQAGFENIKFFSTGLSDYQAQSKTIYCVCRK